MFKKTMVFTHRFRVTQSNLGNPLLKFAMRFLIVSLTRFVILSKLFWFLIYYLYRKLLYRSDSQRVFSGSGTSTSFVNMIKMQILRTHPRPIEWQTLWMGSVIILTLKNFLWILKYTKVWDSLNHTIPKLPFNSKI